MTKQQVYFRKDTIKYYHEIKNFEKDKSFIKIYHTYALINNIKVENNKDGFYPVEFYDDIASLLKLSRKTFINYLKRLEALDMIYLIPRKGFRIKSKYKIFEKRGYRKFENKNGKSYYAFEKIPVETAIELINSDELYLLTLLNQLNRRNRFYNKDKSNNRTSGTRNSSSKIKNSDNVKDYSISLRSIIGLAPAYNSDNLSLIYSSLNKLKKKGYLKIKKHFSYPIPMTFHEFSKKHKGDSKWIYNHGMACERLTSSYTFCKRYLRISNPKKKNSKENLNPYSDYTNDQMQLLIEKNRDYLIRYGIISDNGRKVSYRSYNAIIKRLTNLFSVNQILNLFSDYGIKIRKYTKEIKRWSTRFYNWESDYELRFEIMN